jgi:CelD/BcsL family acetyltransferase involved in cellulose biosynthesis/glycosyltransferase involved in cell wall biosynthesis
VFSVVVPTYNRGRLLGATLESLLIQDADFPYEVIVVDNNSSDETSSVIQDFVEKTGGKVRYIFERAQGSSAARNAGIEASRGDILAFVDDDIIADRGWLSALAEAFGGCPDAWCVGGKVTLRLPRELPGWFDPAPGIMTTYLSLQDLGPATLRLEYPQGLISANLAISRVALSRVGLFDAALGRFGLKLLCGEDVELCLRVHKAGGGVYYCGRAEVAHLVPRARVTKRFLRERAYWEGRTDGLMAARMSPRPTAVDLANLRVTVAKDWAKALFYHGVASGRRAMGHELSARKMLGYLHQTALSNDLEAEANGASPLAADPTITVVGDLQELQTLREPWDDLVQQAGVSIFQTFEWQTAWWKTFSSGRSLHTMLVWEGGRLVGIVPFFLEPKGIGGIRLFQRLRFVGCVDSDYLTVIAQGGREELVARAVARHLVSGYRAWDVLELEDVPEDSQATDALVRALVQHGCTVTRRVHHTCWRIPLLRSMKAYLDHLGSHKRKDLLYIARRLEREGGQVELIAERSEVDGAINDLIALHQGQWVVKGQHGAFADPWTRAFHREVAQALHERGWLHLAFLRLNGDRVAGDYGFTYDGKVYIYLGGFDQRSKWARFSPGMVLHLKTIEGAIGAGMREYDLLRGSEPYKRRLGARERINWYYEVVAPNPSVGYRVAWRAIRGATSLWRAAHGKARGAMRRVLRRS